MEDYIGQISKLVQVLKPDNSGKEANEVFQANNTLEGIVVVDDDYRPSGIITRTQFYQRLGSRYGYDLYMKRSINLLMDENYLEVDYYTPILQVSNLAMNRQQENLYDFIVVTRDGKYFGVVSIKTLLLKISEIQISIARLESPLTGLPGNIVIREKMKELLHNSKYTILYLDLDNFKAFNDVYGFKEGDEVIRATASIITSKLKEYGKQGDFVGHIGGDDFIAILSGHEYMTLCNAIINEFDAKIIAFYNQEDLERGYIYTSNRKGVKQKYPIVSLSIAVVTNKEKSFDSVENIMRDVVLAKSKCKTTMGSCYCSNDSQAEQSESDIETGRKLNL